MAPPLEIAIPTASTTSTSPPYTVYNITLRLPLRSFAICKRYSDFTTFHTALTTQTNAPPPLPLPPKSWFSNTVSNTTLRESRREGLEAYLRAINESDDPRWRSCPAWRAFLNLPSLGNSNNNSSSNINSGIMSTAAGRHTTSARLHAAITDPGSTAPITDPTLWLDCYRDMKGHLHDARLHLTRRDQESTPQKQHESSARAKSSLVRAGTLINALEEGLRNLAADSALVTSDRSSGKSVSLRRGEGGGSKESSHTHHTGSGASLGEGELRRRKDLLINTKKEKDGLEDLLNAMASKSRIDNAVASMKDKEALIGGAATNGGARKLGRVLGRETERTRELDNQGVLQLQAQTMQEQDQSVQGLMKIVQRQKELGIAINAELEIQNELLRMADEDTTRLEQKVNIGKKRLGKIS